MSIVSTETKPASGPALSRASGKSRVPDRAVESPPTWVFWIRRAGVALPALLLVLSIFFVVDRLAGGGEIGRRIEVAGVDVAGMTPDEAAVELRHRANDLVSQPITVRAGDETLTITPSDIEADADVDSAVDAAMNERRGWNPVGWIAGFFTTRRLGFHKITMSEDKLRDTIGPALAAATVEPKNAEFRVSSDGQSVSVAPSALGRGLDIDAAMSDIRSAIIAHGGSRRVTVPLSDLEPELTTEEAEAMGITEPLGTFTTKFAAGEDRVKNIERISEMLSGTTIAPAERFSVNEKVGKRTEDKGFVSAPVIYDGEYKDDVGGGVSQYATTLYNAAWFAGVPIKEHKAHSFYISRYPLGRDATLSYPHPDLAFVNDNESHVLLKSWVGESSVTVTLYGTKDGRTVESETGERYDYKDPETVRRKDETLAPGTEKTVQTEKRGYSVDAFRTIVYANGETKKEKTTTVYIPQNRIVLYNEAPAPTTTISPTADGSAPAGAPPAPPPATGD